MKDTSFELHWIKQVCVKLLYEYPSKFTKDYVHPAISFVIQHFNIIFSIFFNRKSFGRIWIIFEFFEVFFSGISRLINESESVKQTIFIKSYFCAKSLNHLLSCYCGLL